MKTYCFYTTRGRENAGTDACYKLDGRNRLHVQVDECRERLVQLKNVQNYDGFKIVTCEAIGRNEHTIYSEFTS
jgi:hypothetical protein